MRGLEVFKEKFADYSGNYVVIGGMACLIIFEDIGEQFRATQDVDMVLLIERNIMNCCWHKRELLMVYRF